MNKDIHDSVYDEIEARIQTLQAGAPTSSPATGAWTQGEADATLGKLETDKALLLEHWKTLNGVVCASPPSAPRARACGNPQPCPHVLELAEEYGIL